MAKHLFVSIGRGSGSRLVSRLVRPLVVAAAAVVVATTALGPASAADDPFAPVSPQSPDSQVDVTGTPFAGTTAGGSVRGYVDAHTHLMSDVGFGGNIVCGATFSPNGIADALRDCDYHYPTGQLALLENLTNKEGGGPLDPHDPVGWPTFKDWPKWSSLTHQQMYYKWIERAWRGGLRIMVADAVNNNVLCSLPTQVNRYSCDDMDTVRRQIAETKKLEAFIDAQYGGAGRGWFRIAYSADQARAAIEQGKLAVVLGVEVSNPFGCKLTLGIPGCTTAEIDAGLTELHGLGVRSMFLCHKFDNALCGVRFDEGTQGAIVNFGNFLNTGQWWQVEPCRTALQDHTVAPVVLPSVLSGLIPPGVQLPVYPPGPHCNPRGLSSLGEYALTGMMRRGMVVEVDHMSAKAAARTIDILETANYPGVVSSHSWMDTHLTERLDRLGGFVTQYGHDADDFVDTMHTDEALRSRYGVGYGFGMDMNGFGGTPAPRAGSSVGYPFTTLGGSRADRQVTGLRTWDYNVDGVPHYGLIPDWVEDMRRIGGQQVVDELARGAESYLRTARAAQTWAPAPNLVTGRPATASSHQWDLFTDFRPSRATDGRGDTRWASAWSDNQWWRVDLGSVRQVGRVAVSWEAAHAKAYRIEVSTDGSSWRTVSSVTDGDGGLDVAVFTPTSARYIRVVGVQRATPYGYSIWEVGAQAT
ncbi:MAG TPA: discoidin domain-containing protein [Humibacillus xanthopallidus]|nr:discoidin domain-containing protein [Humibacillus xanthopallidus]